MYKLLLTFRYLRRRLIPVFALLAVMLCVAMLIIVLSIMGGFHDLLETSGRKLMGDVKIAFGTTGLPYYDQLIAELEALPEVEAGTATISTFGLLKKPLGRVGVVEVLGVDPDSYSDVLRYRSTLVWDRRKLAEEDLLDRFGDLDPIGLAMDWPDAGIESPPMVIGMEMNPDNIRTAEGTYDFQYSWLGFPLTLNTMAVSEAGEVIDRSIQQFLVVNEFHSGIFEIDNQRVYIPFDVAQKMLMMDAVPIYEDALDPTSPVVGEVPARASEILIRGRDDISPEQLKPLIVAEYLRFSEGRDMPRAVYINTWKELMGEMLRTVENEKNLMRFLFGLVSLVAVVLILVIFYMIVMEKTRDIGVLRALGASRLGVGSIFLVYAGVIGVLGSALGTTLGALFVIYINEIHDWLGRSFGIVIWDRSVYFFDRIPNQVDWQETVFVVIAAIIASVMGAIVPAIKAARVDPVESLRYE